MIDIKWLLSEQKKYMKGELITYEFASVPFAIILGETHSDADERVLENNIIAKFMPEYILVEPETGAWIFDPNKNQARLRDDEPLDCPEDLERMQTFLNETTDFKSWSIKYKIPLVSCDLCSNEKKTLNRIYDVLPQKIRESNILDIIINRQREEKMGEIISKYAKKSSMPIIVILGHKHASPTSRIHAILKQEGVGYLILTIKS